MTQLNQILAIEGDAKKHLAEAWAGTLHVFGKGDLFAGMIRTYVPLDAEGDPQPSEVKEVQLRVTPMIHKLGVALIRAMDLMATKDATNANAVASVEIDGQTILPNLPAVTLLALEKYLKDLEAFVKNIPVLSQDQQWSMEEATGLWVTAPVKSLRTKKVPTPVVLYHATEKHPAQVQLANEDKTVGTWTKIEKAGAWPATQVEEALNRIRTLSAAVKSAREKANGVTVDDRHVGDAIFKYVFGK